jgi:hypothetical protein
MGRANHKQRTEVRISLSGRSPREGVLFGPRRGSSPDRVGTVLELLNSGEAFLPFEENPDGVTILLNRSRIQWVSLAVASGACHPDQARYIREELVQVGLCEGHSLKGLIVLELDNPTRRASDYLNGPDRFFRLVAPDAQYFINKAAVVDMIVFETSPVPELLPVEGRGA